MNFTDTHCHIHEAGYSLDIDEVISRAGQTGIHRLICVGTDEVTSKEAVRFVEDKDNTWASVGLHPHDAKSGVTVIGKLRELLDSHQKIVAIGECGLDYFYSHSPREVQVEMLHEQIQLAKEYDLPLIFHVREAFDDFWPIFDSYSGLRGVLHSFTDTKENLEMALQRGLYIGVNGISTFTKVDTQKQMYASIPLDRLLLETDAPFLTPVPKRGTVNEPAFVMHVAEHIANLQSINLTELSSATEQNATTLFSLN